MELLFAKYSVPAPIAKVYLNAKIREMYEKAGVVSVLRLTGNGDGFIKLDRNVVTVDSVELNGEVLTRLAGDFPVTDLE